MRAQCGGGKEHTKRCDGGFTMITRLTGPGEFARALRNPARRGYAGPREEERAIGRRGTWLYTVVYGEWDVVVEDVLSAHAPRMRENLRFS